MIKFSNCDYCKKCNGFKNGHPTCEAFPDGIPYEQMDKKKTELKQCNNGIGFEPKKKND